MPAALTAYADLLRCAPPLKSRPLVWSAPPPGPLPFSVSRPACAVTDELESWSQDPRTERQAKQCNACKRPRCNERAVRPSPNAACHIVACPIELVRAIGMVRAERRGLLLPLPLHECTPSCSPTAPRGGRALCAAGRPHVAISQERLIIGHDCGHERVHGRLRLPEQLDKEESEGLDRASNTGHEAGAEREPNNGALELGESGSGVGGWGGGSHDDSPGGGWGYR
jgi:hypothetical protein